MDTAAEQAPARGQTHSNVTTWLLVLALLAAVAGIGYFAFGDDAAREPDIRIVTPEKSPADPSGSRSVGDADGR